MHPNEWELQVDPHVSSMIGLFIAVGGTDQGGEERNAMKCHLLTIWVRENGKEWQGTKQNTTNRGPLCLSIGCCRLPCHGLLCLPVPCSYHPLPDSNALGHDSSFQKWMLFAIARSHKRVRAGKARNREARRPSRGLFALLHPRKEVSVILGTSMAWTMTILQPAAVARRRSCRCCHYAPQGRNIGEPERSLWRPTRLKQTQRNPMKKERVAGPLLCSVPVVHTLLAHSYEGEYNGGMGSNGLTSARHDVFCRELAEKYPECYDPRLPESVVCRACVRRGQQSTTKGDSLLSRDRRWNSVLVASLRSFLACQRREVWVGPPLSLHLRIPWAADYGAHRCGG